MKINKDIISTVTKGTGVKKFFILSTVLLASTLITGCSMTSGNVEDNEPKQVLETITPNVNEAEISKKGDITIEATKATEILEVDAAKGVQATDGVQAEQEMQYRNMTQYNFNDECIIYHPAEWSDGIRIEEGSVYFYEDADGSYIDFRSMDFTDENITDYRSKLEYSASSFYEMDTDSGQKLYVTVNNFQVCVEMTAYAVDLENKKQYILHAIMMKDFYGDNPGVFVKMAKSMSIIANGYANHNEDMNELETVTDHNNESNISDVLKAYYYFFINPVVYKEKFLDLLDNTTFSFVDLNHDGIPELLIDTDDFGMAIQQILFTYYNGDVVPIGDYGHGSFQQYESGNIFSAVSVSMGYLTQNFYQIIENQMVEVATIYSDAGATLGESTLTYKIDENKVDEATFIAYMEEHMGDAFAKITIDKGILSGEDLVGTYSWDAKSLAKAVSDYIDQE